MCFFYRLPVNQFLSFTVGSAKGRRKTNNCCGQLDSFTAIKYAIVFLYILVLLTIFGLCIAGRHVLFFSLCHCLCLKPYTFVETNAFANVGPIYLTYFALT